MQSVKRGLTVIVGVAAATLASSSFGSTIRDDVPDSSYQTLAASSDFASVGSLTAGFYNGSGVLISPDWVLTASHLLLFSSSATFTINGTTYSSSAVYHDPAWTGTGTSGGDFGLVHLSTPVTNVAPASLYLGNSEFGLLGTYVGYGAGGTGLTGYQLPPDGKKRAFQDIIDTDFHNPAQVFGSLFVNPHDPSTGIAQPLEGCVSPGDSGGGVFIQVGSQYELAGVISFVAATNGSPNSYYSNFSGFSQLYAGLSWLQSIAPDAVPEPSAVALILGTGLVACELLRRKIGIR